jgi:hypothetical protein
LANVFQSALTQSIRIALAGMLRILGVAFEQVCIGLLIGDCGDDVKNAIAKKIIELAMQSTCRRFPASFQACMPRGSPRQQTASRTQSPTEAVEPDDNHCILPVPCVTSTL